MCKIVDFLTMLPTVSERQFAFGGRPCRPALMLLVSTASAKDRSVLVVMARRLESPLDSIVTPYYRRTRQVAENDDTADPSEDLITHHAGSHLLTEARSDGANAVRITDPRGRRGDEFAYRLRVSPPRHDFTLAVSPAHRRVRRSEAAVAKVKALRTDAFWPEINLEVAGLPEEFAVSRAILGKGQSETRFTITAPQGCGIGGPLAVGNWYDGIRRDCQDHSAPGNSFRRDNAGV
jgi:hypothetical protein